LFDLYILDNTKSKISSIHDNKKDILPQGMKFGVVAYGLKAIFSKPFDLLCFYWWLIYLPRMILGKSGFSIYWISVDGEVIHKTFLLPKCFKFPFMKPDDLFVGPVWTHPLYRRKGLSQFIFQQIKNTYNDNTNITNIRFWWMWLVLETNLASVELAKRLGFSNSGLKTKKRYGIYKLYQPKRQQ